MRIILITPLFMILLGLCRPADSQKPNQVLWSDSTLLPLLVIDTDGKEIPDEPRITARMGLIDNEIGGYNKTSDPYNEYDGQISIELRGESSLYYYPKKSFSIETQSASGSNNNVSLLGLPEENDFVLNAPYGDKSLIRNMLSYRLYEKFGHYSPRTRFVEVVLNGDYQGVYVLTEKIKRDKNRVDIAKITLKDTTSIDISGGYLLRVDKTTGMDPTQYWESPVNPPLVDYNRVVYQYYDPAYDELTAGQKDYIQGHMQKFEEALGGQEFKDPQKGYRAFLDIPSFIDLMILNEFTKDVDAFRLSHYFYKQKDTRGGKLVSGPPWDYNLTFGNNDFTPDMHLTDHWIYTKGITIYWWAWIMSDTWFTNQLYCRWDDLHATVLSQEGVNGMIDTTLQLLDGAIGRNSLRWPTWGEYVWPNSFVAQNFPEEESFLRNWINERLQWIDGKWGGMCQPLSDLAIELIPDPRLKVFPNPSDLSNTFISLSIQTDREVSIILYDLSGRMVYQSRASYSDLEFAYLLPDLSTLPSGLYTLEVSDGKTFREMSKLLKK